MPHAHPNPRWTRADFALSAEELAPALLGEILVHIDDNNHRRAAIIIETEAYTGINDRASHAYNARRTKRTEPMFGHPGTSYVYFTYGMHHCFNIACSRLNDPAAVLIRAAEPTEGLDHMRAARTIPGKPTPSDVPLCKGPANLCRAFSLNLSHTNLDLTTSPQLFIEHPSIRPEITIARSPRIGLGDKGDWSQAPLRFFIANHKGVSKGPMARPVSR